jgi:prepilin-type N-terminal cleavage/methylation domain-containing protein
MPRRRHTARDIRRGGMTLIELLAGLVVLGTVLASVAVARGRFMRQWADADRKLLVTRAADAMLENWMIDPTRRVPLHGQGPLAGAPECDWQTAVLNEPESATLGAMTIRLSVFDRKPSYPGAPRRTSSGPVLTVDLLVHKMPKVAPTRPAKDSRGAGI